MDLKTWFILNDGLDWKEIDIRQIALDEDRKFTPEEVNFIKSLQKLTDEEAERAIEQRCRISPNTKLPIPDLSTYPRHREHDRLAASIQERIKKLKSQSNS